MTGVMTFIFPGINPEPWAIGPIAWRTQAGKRMPVIGPVRQLVTYQEALQAKLKKQLPAGYQLAYSDMVRLEFYFWRRLDKHRNTEKGREITAKVSDATNMQKGTEDALQSVLFKNDNQVKDIRSVVVDEGEGVSPGVIIKMAILPVRTVPNVLPEMLARFFAEQSSMFDMSDVNLETDWSQR